MARGRSRAGILQANGRLWPPGTAYTELESLGSASEAYLKHRTFKSYLGHDCSMSIVSESEAIDLTPRATSQTIYLPGRTGGSKDEHFHIFYLVGNPGCIAYYHAFLTLLQEKALSTNGRISLSIYGESYPNYSDEASFSSAILGLRGLIAHNQKLLLKYAQAQQREANSDKPIKIILSGHSLGTYIGLELLRWWQEEGRDSPAHRAIEIVGYLGLWCTVTWINKSPSGQIAKRAFNLPYFLSGFCSAAEYLISPLPTSILLPLVSWFTGFPDDSARVTCDFLKSEKGIRQALFLGRDELNEILEDKWSDEIWGTATSGEKKSKLVFHFGAVDHWVANDVRDELIKLRGTSGPHDVWKPIMEVDKNGIPHAFCIHHSSQSADIAVRHLETILDAHVSKGRS